MSGTDLPRNLSLFSRLQEATAAGAAPSKHLESRYGLLRTMSLPPPIAIPSATGGVGGGSGRVCATPLPTPGKAAVPRAPVLPEDWRIMTSAQFLSTTAFNVGGPSAAADFHESVASFTKAAGTSPLSTVSTEFRRGMLYWCHPDVALPSGVTQLRTSADPVVAALFHDRIAQWMLAARSAFDAIVAGSSRCFYIQVRGSACACPALRAAV